MRARIIFHPLLVSAFLSCIFYASGGSAQSFLFASPNTREHATDEAAWDSLDSFEQSNFLEVARYLAGKLCAKPEVTSAEGLSGDSAENSSLVTGCSESKTQYLGELLGRYAHQKWILVFNSAPGGADRLLIVDFTTDHPANIAKELRQSGITAGTIVMQDRTVRIYLWVKDHSQDAALQTFLTAHHGAIKEAAGKATLIGNEDRRKAQAIFDQCIGSYEHAHHLALSRLLWSRWLRDRGLGRIW